MANTFIPQQDNPRKLYIFAKEPRSLLLQQQVSLLQKDSTGLAERDLQVVTVSKAAALWETLNVSPTAFTVILIGKDGGEKYRSHQLLQPSKLYSLVDAMPMRKQEIKNRKNNR